jgi:hypothetical protein
MSRQTYLARLSYDKRVVERQVRAQGSVTRWRSPTGRMECVAEVSVTSQGLRPFAGPVRRAALRWRKRAQQTHVGEKSRPNPDAGLHRSGGSRTESESRLERGSMTSVASIASDRPTATVTMTKSDSPRCSGGASVPPHPRRGRTRQRPPQERVAESAEVTEVSRRRAEATEGELTSTRCREPRSERASER